MKKVIRLLSLILLIMILMIGNVYATFECKVDMVSSDVKENEFTVDVKLLNVKTDNGIISLGATLEYDDNLELEEMQGKNGWETPKAGSSSYNASNGKMALTRDSVGKSDEVVFTMKFKIKSDSKKDFDVSLKNISVSDGDTLLKLNDVSKNIKVAVGSGTEQKPDNTTQNPNNPSQNTNTTQKPDNTTQNPNNPSQNTNTTQKPNNTVQNTNTIQTPNNVNTNNTQNSNNSNQTTIITPTTNANKNNANKNNTSLSESLPYAGGKSPVVLIVIGAVVLVSSILLIKIKIDKRK